MVHTAIETAAVLLSRVLVASGLLLMLVAFLRRR